MTCYVSYSGQQGGLYEICVGCDKDYLSDGFPADAIEKKLVEVRGVDFSPLEIALPDPRWMTDCGPGYQRFSAGNVSSFEAYGVYASVVMHLLDDAPGTDNHGRGLSFLMLEDRRNTQKIQR